jgi:hypothetical protein
MLGGLEILIICSIIGGILGIFLRDKSRSAWIGFALGAVGAAVTSYVLVQTVFASFIAIPFYSLLGSWLFNFLFKKISR